MVEGLIFENEQNFGGIFENAQNFCSCLDD